MKMKPAQHSRQWLLLVAGVGSLGILGAVLALLQGDYPSIERVYRPARAGIEQAIVRRVRHGKGHRLIEFYGGWYMVDTSFYRMEFASEPGTYRIGDTMWVLYNPAQPESNVTYDGRRGAIHLDRSNIQNVLLDFDAVKLYMDSLERARSGR